MSFVRIGLVSFGFLDGFSDFGSVFFGFLDWFFKGFGRFLRIWMVSFFRIGYIKIYKDAYSPEAREHSILS